MDIKAIIFLVTVKRHANPEQAEHAAAEDTATAAQSHQSGDDLHHQLAARLLLLLDIFLHDAGVDVLQRMLAQLFVVDIGFLFIFHLLIVACFITDTNESRILLFIADFGVCPILKSVIFLTVIAEKNNIGFNENLQHTIHNLSNLIQYVLLIILGTLHSLIKLPVV